MEVKTLDLNLGVVKAGEAGPEYSPGWYQDAAGNRYYYDGSQWYVQAAGYLYPVTALVAYMNAAPYQVTVAPGDKLQISTSFSYSGPAITGAIIYYSIGIYGALGFSEQMVGQNTKNLGPFSSPQTISDSYTFTIPSNIGSNWTSIYAKVMGGSPDLGNPAMSGTAIFGYQDALIIAGLTPDIANFTITKFAKA